MKNQILSVGIDIGTTTSQVIFSRLTIENKAAVSRVPSISITEKEIIYRSDIYITPLIDHFTIDGNALAKIVDSEYEKAGVNKKDITVGAVIITGESSRKENSKEVVNALGELAGDFVVASAGPDLEGIIAGRGSGASDLSKEKRCIVANIDVGGGTSNIAIFDDGVCIDTACFDIGGRQIKFEKHSLKVNYIAPKTLELCKKLGLSLEVGRSASPSEIETLCRKYVELLAEGVGLKEESPELNVIVTNHTLLNKHNISHVIISGGVAISVYDDVLLENYFQYDDIGIILGKTLRDYFPHKLTEGRETIRATVIGAGAFTASLSGSTIHVSVGNLPLKNIPVIKFSAAEEGYDKKKLIETINKKIEWNLDVSANGIVLGFEFVKIYGYDELKDFADVFILATEHVRESNKILVIVIENDFAKALGQLLSMKCDFPFIVLDSIRVQDGDFMDIGEPLYNGSVVPVVIKSLIFNK